MQRWLEMAAGDLRDHTEILNALNVFPVADADTGSNLAATVETAALATEMLETPDLSELVTLAGQAALEEARGNSGTLFAVFLTAMGDGLQSAERLHAEALVSGLSAGSVRAWSVLTDPVPGTMLSVLAAAAAVPVPDHGEPGSKQQLTRYLRTMVAAAKDAVVASTQELEVLRGTRKVDAGALGLLIILDALRRALVGHNPTGPELWGGAEQSQATGAGTAESNTSQAGTTVPDGAAQVREDAVQSAEDATQTTGESGQDTYDSEDFEPVGQVLTLIGYDLYPPVEDADAAAMDALKAATTGVEVMATMDMSALAAATIRHELDETGNSVIVSAVSEIDEQTWRWRVHVHVPEQQMALEILRRHGSPRNITVTGLGNPATGPGNTAAGLD
ncbi:DAK2 domain-containing protein [Kocuria sp.]|uniref:DAK2 domain-containing protein n=1 Tax=Kocuria sp. TaxID=1871328 RepID=UPI0026DFFB4A|nr:DAK2 domain-containing protein [Kocuria sp.]MDO5618323.1 DAK2 domain-containing protein [Kocuria sp.]